MKQITLIVIFFLSLASCDQPDNSRRANPGKMVPIAEKDPGKYYSFFNEELPEKQLEASVEEKFNKNLEVARKAYEANPDSLENIIWYGRRLAYLGKHIEAINIFSEGLQKFPNSYQLRRHRGHRYITTRQLAKAIDDFEMAAFYSLNAPDQIEPDGLPNKLNQPLSTDKFNIWYHYGLAHYLSGRYDKALSAYTKCMEFSENNDLKVATTYWLYLTYRKLGNKELAENILTEMDTDISLIENEAYLSLLRLFKGEKEVNTIEGQAFPEEGKIDPTLGYGIGIWYQHQQQLEKANETFLKILDSPAWDAFGFIASEAELTSTFPVPTS